MGTLTEKTETKTFKSGQGVKAQRYWKDATHFYKIINEYDLITVYYDRHNAEKALIERTYFKNLTSIIVETLMSEDEHFYEESSKKEFDEAFEKALKIINLC